MIFAKALLGYGKQMNNKQLQKLIVEIVKYRWNKYRFKVHLEEQIERCNVIEDSQAEFTEIEWYDSYLLNNKRKQITKAQMMKMTIIKKIY